MKNEHKLIQDLFPSYIDGLTSDETNEFIEEHIKSCEKCNKILGDMKVNIQEENHTNLNDKKVKFAKKINGRLKFLGMFIFIAIIVVLVIIGNIIRKNIILNRLNELRNRI